MGQVLKRSDDLTPAERYTLVSLAPGWAMIWDGSMDEFTPAKHAMRITSLVGRGYLNADGSALTEKGWAYLNDRWRQRNER
jgi:hypothetical protein